MKDKKDIKLAIIVITVVFIVYGCLHLLGIGCPIKFITGVSCAGCGMTRACISAAHLDFGTAFYYHPLFPLLIPMGILFLLRDRLSKNQKNTALFFFGAVFMIVYFIRMFDPSQDIVVFHPENGAFVRLVRFIGALLKSV